MPRILLLNPNTSADFTEKIGRIARAYAQPSTQILALNPASGPRSIEGIYDELLSAAPTLEVALRHLDDVDAISIACFSDHPTVYALRELTELPVLGIAEAGMHLACLVGRAFSVVTTNHAWRPLLLDAARRFGLAERCASVRATGLPVLALEGSGQATVTEQIRDQARLALDQDHAEVIVLGCAGMAGLDKELEAELRVPVVDGVAASVKLLESLAGYGLRTSKRQTYATPAPKPLDGLDPLFEKPYRAEP
ncbi:MAG: aspartate/glutamate racemase family protein [Chloroflexota bacterium]